MIEGITFSDVLIVPKYSDIETRTSIDVKSHYLGKDRLPIISSPMDYVTGMDMAKRMDELDAYGIVSRFGDKPQWAPFHDFGVAVGIDWDKAQQWIYDSNPTTICIDVAHGDHQNTVNAIKRWKDFTGGGVQIIAGNVATRDGFNRLADAGADAIRVGIGPGSACSTRENTGVGVPQMTAIMECAAANYWRGQLGQNRVTLIADGGIQYPGDIAKALAAGADAVMLGNMLAGHDESPGKIIPMNGGFVKSYRGQSLLGTNGLRNAPEGVEGFVPYKGTVKDTIDKLMHYLRSSMSYVGARNLTEFRERAEFVRVSPATLQENRTRI